MTNAVNLASAAGTGFAFRNRIINGDMRIDQRNNGASVGTSSGTSGYSLDRWFYENSQTSKFTMQRNAGGVTPPSYFDNYLGVTSSSAYTVLASDYFHIGQRIEGVNVSDLGWGAIGALSVTLSFWVRSSLTGTFGGAIRNRLGTRSYPFTFTITNANTWEFKTVTIPGDTTGTWDKDSVSGLQLTFGIGTGSTYLAAAGSWAAGNYISATGATSVVGTNGATFYLTGVQLEVGSVATPFERRPYGQELALCQRYFCKSSSLNVVPVNGAAYATAGMFFSSVAGAYLTTAAYTPFMKFPVTMRTEPATITIYNTNLPSPSTAGQWSIFSPSGGVWYNCSVSVQSVTQEGWAAALAGSWGSSGGLPLYGAWAASAEL